MSVSFNGYMYLAEAGHEPSRALTDIGTDWAHGVDETSR